MLANEHEELYEAAMKLLEITENVDPNVQAYADMILHNRYKRRNMELTEKMQREENREEGRAEGERLKAIEIAKTMITENISLETISKCSGLSLEDLKELIKG